MINPRIGIESFKVIQELKVPCKYCKTPTPMLGTKMCDGCWEVSRNIRNMPRAVLRAIIQAEKGVRIQFTKVRHDGH